MGNEFKKIADQDGDTYITVEPTADGDIIRMYNQDVLTFEMSADGERTMPKQPAFNAIPASDQNNIAVGSDVTVVFGTERFDQNDDFASNIFTAPIDGKYQLSASLYFLNIPSDAVYFYLKLITSNKTYGTVIPVNHASGSLSINLSILADMDASDTAYVTLKQAVGTQQTDINTGLTTFNGFLAC